MTVPEAAGPEFSREIDVRQAGARNMTLETSTAEREALARRFDLVRIDSLTAELALTREEATVAAEGRLTAAIVQTCAVSGEDLPVVIDEPLNFRFVPATGAHTPDEEVELDADDCDEIEYAGSMIDLGEAVAQSLGLAIDPFAAGPDAEKVREAGLLGEEDAGPFAALKGLKLGKD